MIATAAVYLIPELQRSYAMRTVADQLEAAEQAWRKKRLEKRLVDSMRIDGEPIAEGDTAGAAAALLAVDDGLGVLPTAEEGVNTSVSEAEMDPSLLLWIRYMRAREEVRTIFHGPMVPPGIYISKCPESSLLWHKQKWTSGFGPTNGFS